MDKLEVGPTPSFTPACDGHEGAVESRLPNVAIAVQVLEGTFVNDAQCMDCHDGIVVAHRVGGLIEEEFLVVWVDVLVVHELVLGRIVDQRVDVLQVGFDNCLEKLILTFLEAERVIVSGHNSLVALAVRLDQRAYLLLERVHSIPVLVGGSLVERGEEWQQACLDGEVRSRTFDWLSRL